MKPSFLVSAFASWRRRHHQRWRRQRLQYQRGRAFACLSRPSSVVESGLVRDRMPNSESNAEKGISSEAASSAADSSHQKPLSAMAQQHQQPQGLSQSSKDDIGVCVVIILITVLAIIVTIIKIVLFDIANYPELFSSGGGSDTTTTTAPNTTTTS